MKKLLKTLFIFSKHNARNALLIALIILNCLLLTHIKTMSKKIIELEDIIEKIDFKEEDKINDDFDYYYEEKNSKEIKDI